MTDGITATVAVRVTAQDSKAPPIGGATQQVNVFDAVTFAPGNGATGLADRMYTQAIDIAASGSETLDLSTITDAFGVAIALTELQAVILIAAAGNTNNIVMGNATDPWVGPFDAGSDTVSVKPGGMLVMADPLGWAVVASTGMNLKLANSSSGSAVLGTLILIGRSA